MNSSPIPTRLVATLFLVPLFVPPFAPSARAQDSMRAPIALHCEHQVEPLALDEHKPRFTWELVDKRRSAKETAYQILVAPSAEDLALDKGRLWDSDKVKSNETVLVEYAGRDLEPGQQCWWKVRVWDASDVASPWSAISRFGIGLLGEKEWKAQWIADATPSTKTPAPASNAINGWHSEFSKNEDDYQWIQFDLGPGEKGSGQIFDQLVLYPAHPRDPKDSPDYLWPSRFKCWFSDEPTFLKKAMGALDHSQVDLRAPGDKPVVFKLDSVFHARYLRVAFMKNAKVEGRGYAVAFAEAQLRGYGAPLTQDVTMTVSSSIESDGWSLKYLSDGDLVSHGGTAHATAAEPGAAPLLRKEFDVHGKLERAILRTSALGLYRATLNHIDPIQAYLLPGWTDYTQRVPYQTSDITSIVQQGKNVLAAEIGDGWYAGRIGLSNIVPGGPSRGIYGEKPQFLAQLDLTYADGKHEVIATDASWKSTLDGAVRSNDLLDGENQDLRLERSNFDMPKYDDKGWHAVAVMSGAHPKLEAERCEPVRMHETLKPITMAVPKPGIWVFDFGQNITGFVRFDASAPKDGTVTLRHAEVLEDDGTVYTANLRGAAAIDRFTLTGRDKETCEPHFSVHGFRYVQVEGLAHAPERSDIVAIAISTAARATSSFETATPILAQLWRNIGWTLRDNLIGVPTDCPQRDERMGWMGDIGSFAPTAIYQLDLAPFFTKWLVDVRDAQADDGRFADFAPHPFGKNERFTGTPAWGDAGVIVPWAAYLAYGDKRLIAAQLPAAERWVDWIAAKNPDGIWTESRGDDFGDWLNGSTLVHEHWNKAGCEVPKVVLATAFWAHSCELVSKMAAALGKKDEAARYAKQFEKVRGMFQKAYLQPDGTITGDTQAGYALAMDFGLVPENYLTRVMPHLSIGITEKREYSLTTGMLTTHRMLLALTERHYEEVASRLVRVKNFPSWGFEIDNGATTIWERWDGFVKGRGFQDPSMNSFNHYAFGSVGEWMMRALAGIAPDEEAPGYARFIVRPRPGLQIPNVNASYHSIRGEIVSNWKIENERMTLELTVPPNTAATLYLPVVDFDSIKESGRPVVEAAPHVVPLEVKPGEATFDVRAGKYRFETRYPPPGSPLPPLPK